MAERWPRQKVEINIGRIGIGSPLCMEFVLGRRPVRPLDAMRKGRREDEERRCGGKDGSGKGTDIGAAR